MARRHRILARATKLAVKLTITPVVVAGWGCVLLVIYWKMITGKAGKKSKGTQKDPKESRGRHAH